MTRPVNIGDERGTTIVELMVATASGMVVLLALTMAILSTMHGTSRVSARVHATQNARLATTNVIEALHSACLAPKISPVYAGSTGTSLTFVHAARGEGAEAAPEPVKSTISLSGTTLTQYDYAWKSGETSNEWAFAESATERRLATDVGPAPGNSSIFSYYAYDKGGLTQVATTGALSEADAATTVHVVMKMTATPDGNSPVADGGAPATVQGSATLRLTPPSFNEEAPGPPCQ